MATVKLCDFCNKQKQQGDNKWKSIRISVESVLGGYGNNLRLGLDKSSIVDACSKDCLHKAAQQKVKELVNDCS